MVDAVYGKRVDCTGRAGNQLSCLYRHSLMAAIRIIINAQITPTPGMMSQRVFMVPPKKRRVIWAPHVKEEFERHLMMLFVRYLLRSKPAEVNRYHSLLVMVPSEPETGSPILLSTISNVPTSSTVIQIIWTTTINQYKIRNGRISARYPRFLKNGIFFSIISPDGNICTPESECDHCENKIEGVYNNFHD